MLKHFIRIMIIVVAAVSLTACSQDKANDTKQTTTVKKEKKTTETDKAVQLVKDYVMKSKKYKQKVTFKFERKDQMLYLIKVLDSKNKIVGWYGVDVPTQTVGELAGDPTK